MAAACVALPIGHLRGIGYDRPKIRRPKKTSLDDIWRRIHEDAPGICTRTLKRCDSATPQRCPSTPTSRSNAAVTSSDHTVSALVADLLLSISLLSDPRSDGPLSVAGTEELPPYLDLQPLARSYIERAASSPEVIATRGSAKPRTSVFCDPSMDDSIDFGEASGVRTRGKAKKKKAAMNWDDNDEDANKGSGGNEGADGAGAGGGGGGDDGGGAAGAGGNGDGGGGAGDGDDWEQGAKKTKGKKKKAKQEEEERKAKEEEEAAKEKEKEEEDAGPIKLDWADDTNDAAANDSWAAFTTPKTTAKKKKGKKGAAEEPTPPVPDPPTSAFQEISLDDGAPKLDFEFGGTDSKKGSGIGGLGNWGSSWDFMGTGTTPDKKEEKLSKGGIDKESKDTSLGDNNPWSPGTKTKAKKKSTINPGFDFGDLNNSGKDDLDLGFNDTSIPKIDGDDTWGYATSGKKDKKKGKDVIEKKEKITALPDPEPEPEPEQEQEKADQGYSWGAVGASIWGGSKKDKNKAKKGDSEETETLPTLVADSIPDKDENPVSSGFDWSVGTSTKATAKKGKKKTKDSLFDDDEPIVAIEDSATGDITGVNNDSWMDTSTPWNSTSVKKKGKKGLKAVEEPAEIVESPPAIETFDSFGGDNDFGFSTSKSKKDKKAKKGSDIPPVPPPPPEPEDVGGGDTWAGFGSKDKKGGKSAKATSTIPLVPDPEPVEPEKEDLSMLTPKERRKREKEIKKQAEADAEAKKAAENAAATDFAISPLEKTETFGEEDPWGNWDTPSTKKKAGKKTKNEPPPPVPTPPAQGLSPEPGPTVMSDLEADFAELTTTKSKPSAKKGTLSKSTTLSGKGSKSEDAKAKKKDVKEAKEDPITSPDRDETPAKAVKSAWGGFSGTTSASKTKKEKEKEKKEADEKARKEKEEKEEEERKEEEEKARQQKEADELDALLAAEPVEPPKKGSKLKKEKAGKASKTEIKGKDKKEEEKKKKEDDYDDMALIDILDEPPPPSPPLEKITSKSKKGDAKLSKKDLKKKEEEEAKQAKEKLVLDVTAEEEEDPDDFFGTGTGWGMGSSKKTTGKTAVETKKEINKYSWANGDDALADFTNDPEASIADQPTPISKSSKTMSTTATKGKTTVSSVAAKIKAFEEKKKDEKSVDKKVGGSKSAKDPPFSPELTKESPEEEKPKSGKESKDKKKTDSGKAKTSAFATTGKAGKRKDSLLADEGKPKDIVPGSFPGAFGDEDDLMALDNFPASPVKKTTTKSSTKKSKDDSKGTSSKKASALMDDSSLLDTPPEPPKLPTPPPEEKKPAKKERAKIERNGATSAWGFLGGANAATKKETVKKKTSKTPDDVPATSPIKKKAVSPGLTRSKSTKTPKEKERDYSKDVEKESKSSTSDTKEKRAEAKPAKATRGMSFSAFMIGGPPPSATKNKMSRRTSVAGGSKASSRRPSVDNGSSGLMSPPPEDQPEISTKAAKLMGVKSPKVVKAEKGKKRASVVPDPYPIDDDDMVMVNSLEDPLINGASSRNPPKGKAATITKSKRESKSTKPRARTLSNEDDVVMVDAGRFAGDPEPDDLAFDHGAPELKRSATTASKKTGGFFGGFFGGGKAEKAPEVSSRARATSLSYKDEKMTDAEALPTRVKDKSKRKSVAPNLTDTEAIDFADLDTPAEGRRNDHRTARVAEEAERAERRKSRRDKEKAELEAKKARAKDRLRKEQEAEDQRREDRRARRAAKEEARLKEEADIEAAAVARREERRRVRAELEAKELGKQRAAATDDEDIEKLHKSSKDDRKRQFEREEEERLRRREEKKSKPSREKERSSKRKSTAPNTPLMDEYFNSRSGAGGNTPRSPGGPPDKTSSWVKSQASDPPDLPPFEGTILDGEKPRRGLNSGLDDEEEHQQSRRRSSKRDKDPAPPSGRRHTTKHVSSRDDPADIAPDRRTAKRRESRRTDRDRDRERDRDPIDPKSGSASDRDRDRDRDRVYSPVRNSHTTKPHRSSRRREIRDDDYDAYADGVPGTAGSGPASPASPVMRAFDGRPAMGGKRNSIFGKLGGMF